MPDVDFTNLLGVLAIAMVAPLAIGFAPRLQVPAVVLEIVLGVAVGGIPAYGSQRSQWDAGARFDFARPEYR